ncbi:family 16 glycoside hydrolase [Streptosporangium sp. NPDC023615]|uniref:family 16 glycoside hydrolase n=1 Tax=Streptosporangium sp. NPDC023615 TaxID=3154794 RepID=UPI003434D80C
MGLSGASAVLALVTALLLPHVPPQVASAGTSPAGAAGAARTVAATTFPAGAAVASRAAVAGTTYHVDATAGSDAAAGTSPSTAWKTLGKVNAQTFGPGDRVLLRSGGVWTGQYLDLHGSGAAGSPIVLGRYGTGARPVVDFADTAVGGEGFGVRLRNVSHWEIGDLEITSGQQPTDRRRSGVLVVGEGTGAGDLAHIHVRNMYVHDVFGTDRRTGGINLHARGTATGPESTWTDVLIEGNTVDNVADTGIQTMTDALLNTTWAHDMDAFRNLVIRGNTVTRIHRDGILVRSGLAPLVERNTTDRIGESTTSTLPYLDDIAVVAAQWMYATTDAVFQFNQAFRTRRLDGDGQPWDFDQRVYRSVYQYNYSQDNEGGTLLVMDQTDDNVFRYNISQNDLDRSVGVFHLVNGSGDLRVHNNVFYRSAGQTGQMTGTSTGQVAYVGNIFVNQAGGAYSVSGNVTYDHNLYWGANAAQPGDPNEIVADPRFVAPGGATDLASAGAYRLRPGSPAIDSGVAVSPSGGRDFFGTALYQGAPDRGAHESAAVPATVLLADDFGDGDAAGWTTSGGTWSITGGAYSQTSVAAGESLAVTGSAAWTDYTVQGRVRLNNAGANAGLVLRYAGPADFYLFRINDGTDTADLYRRSGGTLTLVASASLPVVPGAFRTLRVSVSGSAVTCSVDGTQVLTWGAATGPAVGRVGLRMHTSTATLDDLIVTTP